MVLWCCMVVSRSFLEKFILGCCCQTLVFKTRYCLTDGGSRSSATHTGGFVIWPVVWIRQ